MPGGLFITGTDTGVGKTLLTSALLALYRKAGILAAPMKPVQTGCDGGSCGLTPPDLERALKIANMEPDPELGMLMCPYRFEPACSPHLAAEQAGFEISLEVIQNAFSELSGFFDAIVVEGAGGLLVPLNDKETMLDLMKTLDLPVVVATRPGLGTLNHTLLTLEALKARDLEVKATVMICSTPDELGFIEEDNLKTLRRLSPAPVLGPIPFLADWDTPQLIETCGPILEELLP